MTDHPNDLYQLIKALMRSSQAGDQTTPITELLDRLRAICRSRLSANDPLRGVMDSADLGQDTMYQLLRDIESFRGSTWPEFNAFIQKIASSKMLELARRHRAQRRTIERAALSDGGALQAPQPGPGPLTANADQDELRRLADRIEALDEPYRIALSLRLAGDDYATIAGKLGIEDTAARKRVSRAIGMLQDRDRGRGDRP